MKIRTLRLRMMLLFCTVVGVILAASYLAFWGLLAHAVHTQLNRQLLETARPIISDLVSEPNAKNISRLDLPGEFFELLDQERRVLQRSKNLAAPMKLDGTNRGDSSPAFGRAALDSGETVRVALIPFQQAGQNRVFAVAIPTFGTNRVLDKFGGVALLLFPLSLLVTAGISALYVGKSLGPIKELTRHAAVMAKRVTNRQGFWKPLPVSSPHDELGRLAETINHLLKSVDAAVVQLRQFVTDASHELRTPLAVLHGETELLLSKPRSAEEYRQTLCVFDDEFKKLTRIVEGLFTLSMADAGQLHLAREPLYINGVLEEASALASCRTRAKTSYIMRVLNQARPFTCVEPDLIERYLILLDNAIKYSPDGTRIHVTLGIRDGAIQARFQDQGVGISPEHLPLIFDRFYRAAPLNSGEAQSVGLGLAIAQAIAIAQGGTIECDSTAGVGSTSTVNLPVREPHEAVPESLPKQKLILR